MRTVWQDGRYFADATAEMVLVLWRRLSCVDFFSFFSFNLSLPVVGEACNAMSGECELSANQIHDDDDCDCDRDDDDGDDYCDDDDETLLECQAL